MFHCRQCDTTVFLAECPACGRMSDTDEIAAGFVEFLRTGKYERPEPDPPEPFRGRLASYLNCDESEVFGKHSVQSTMPLQVLAPIGPYRGPKSRWLIRVILHRVHRLVSQTRHTNSLLR